MSISLNPKQPQPSTAWERFKDRAQDLQTTRNKDCACPPTDWTVNLDTKNQN